MPPLELLKKQLSTEATILSDSSSHEFQTLLKRWSDTDIEIPAAIVLPATEVDCQRAVCQLSKGLRRTMTLLT